jgi:hypothetical protein
MMELDALNKNLYNFALPLDKYWYSIQDDIKSFMVMGKDFWSSSMRR